MTDPLPSARTRDPVAFWRINAAKLFFRNEEGRPPADHALHSFSLIHFQLEVTPHGSEGSHSRRAQNDAGFLEAKPLSIRD